MASSARRALLAGVALLTIGASAPPHQAAELAIAVGGLRNNQGAVMLCLTRLPRKDYLRCASDPARITRSVAAADAGTIRIAGVTPGEYSLLVFHDENRNGRLDKTMGMPREGFGFSRNPAMRLGPPRYADVTFALPPGESRQAIKLRYLL